MYAPSEEGWGVGGDGWEGGVAVKRPIVFFVFFEGEGGLLEGIVMGLDWEDGGGEDAGVALVGFVNSS